MTVLADERELTRHYFCKCDRIEAAGRYRGAWGTTPNKHGDDKIYFQQRYTDTAITSADLMRTQGQVVAAASSVRSGDVQGNGRNCAGLR